MPTGPATALVYCECSSCRPDGMKQLARTAKRHIEEQRAKNLRNKESSAALPRSLEEEEQVHAGEDISDGLGGEGSGPGLVLEVSYAYDDDDGSSDHGSGDSSNDDGHYNRWDASEKALWSDEDSSNSEESNTGDDEGQNTTQDPLFQTRASLFDPALPHNAFTDEDDFDFRELPRAFDDHPTIRNQYIRIFLASAFDGLTHNGASMLLDGYAIGLQAANRRGVSFPGLESYARTLPTVEKRLGVSTDGFITYFFICNICWSVHRPRELLKLESPSCLDSECPGILYTTKRLSDGTEKRSPLLTVPFVPPTRAIRRMVLQPGKVEQWQHWRGPDDQAGRRPGLAVPRDGYDAFGDIHRPMKDIMDGWGWRTILAGLERHRTGKWDVKDVDIRNLRQQFVALPNGLVLQMNLDWFQAVKGGCHSTGALYLTICNNPRTIRYLREETILVLVLPGPHEPTLEQLNNVLGPSFIQDLQQFYLGIKLPVYGQDDPLLFHGQLALDVSDLPASRKADGLQGFTSILFMCSECPATFYSLTDAPSFDPTNFVLRDPWRYLKYSFRAHDLDSDAADEIASKRGIRYSVLHNLVNWLPGVSSLIDFMHAIFLCLVKHTIKNILYNTGMFTSAALDKMDLFFANLIWPPSVSRLPPKISRGAGSVKADQWRTMISVFFVAVYVAWEVDGKIPKSSAPEPATNTKIHKAKLNQERLVLRRLRAFILANDPETPDEDLPSPEDAAMDRSYSQHYDILLEFSASIRILCSHEISPAEVSRGCSALRRAVQAWARMKCHLTPYYHIAASHFEAQFLRFGPSPVFGAYPYERNNRTLVRCRHNGHAGGELECTMMRGWWKMTFIQELISNLESLPRPLAQEDTDSIQLLRSYLRGGTSERRGTLQMYLDRMQATDNPDKIDFPKSSHMVDLRSLDRDIYHLVFLSLRSLWATKFSLISDVDMSRKTRRGLLLSATFVGVVKSFTHLWLEKRRYGASTSFRGQSAQFAYIDARVPVQIEYLFAVEQECDNEIFNANLAIVRRFETDAQIMSIEFPWYLWAVDLGIRAWTADSLASLEVVELNRLNGHFVLAAITIRNHDIWLTIAYDHDRPEEDINMEDDD